MKIATSFPKFFRPRMMQKDDLEHRAGGPPQAAESNFEGSGLAFRKSDCGSERHRMKVPASPGPFPSPQRIETFEGQVAPGISAAIRRPFSSPAPGKTRKPLVYSFFPLKEAGMWAAAPLSRPENVRSAVRLRSASPPKWRDRSAEWEGFGLENRKKTLPDLADDGLKERTKKRDAFPAFPGCLSSKNQRPGH